MKKLIPMLLAMLLAFGMAACGEHAGEAPETQAAVPQASGCVYFLNGSPEADAAWQALAADYTAQTGIPVKVHTPPAGSYSDALSTEMAGDQAPTLFLLGNARDLDRWEDHTLPLEGTGLLEEMTTLAGNLQNEAGETRAMASRLEAFGLLVNRPLLTQAGYLLEDLTDFSALKAAAEDIHSRRGQLGFDAFSPPGLEQTSSGRFSRHLASIALHYEFTQTGVTGQPAGIQGTCLDSLRNLWDLYLANTAADPTTLLTISQAQADLEFQEGRAVFHQGGTWDLPELIQGGMAADQLAMIPLYCGIAGEEDCGLAWGTEDCWAINARASQADIQATIDFVKWTITSEAGTAMLAEQYGLLPFRNASGSEEGLTIFPEEGKNPVSWAFRYLPNGQGWTDTIVTALAAYAADPTDASWQQVRGSFVDGWAYEYILQQSE